MSQNNTIEISVIAPVFNELKNLNEFVNRTENTLKKLMKLMKLYLLMMEVKMVHVKKY